MKFRVSGKLSYDVKGPSTFILNIHAMRTAAQSVLEETLHIEPYQKVEELIQVQNDNRYVRFEVTGKAKIDVNYSALIDTSFKLINAEELHDVAVAQMHPSVLPYLSPSRYCQSDKLFRFAHARFGKYKSAFERVLALSNWIHDNVEYLSGSTNSQTSAYDTATEQAGVCRDFAHLGIALCRALDIPARYFTGYSYLLNPADFHACFEAYLGNEWIIFDATKLAPINGLVKIATGRDAADTAIATIFGNVVGTYMAASCELAEDHFEPIYYTKNNMFGFTYL